MHRDRLFRDQALRLGPSVMTDRRDILAVQTLRNWTMARRAFSPRRRSGLPRARCISHRHSDQPQLLHQLNFLGSVHPTLLTAKLSAIVATLLVAFFNFAVAIRYYNHISIEINVPQPQRAVSATSPWCSA